MWVDGPHNSILPRHFRVYRVVHVLVLVGELRFEGGCAAPFHLRLESLQFGLTPIVFMDKRNAILINAHCPAEVAKLATGTVRSGVVSSTGAE